MNQPLGMDLLDYVAELTRPYVHREPYTVRLGATSYTQHHTTKVPALINQLQYASPSGQGEERGGGGYESRPAASVDAVATLSDIDHEAARWIRRLGQDDPDDTIGCVRRVGSLAAGLVRCKKPARGCCEYHDIEHDAKHWWTQARVMTGWDSPAWRPDSSCPMCAERGTLRIKLVDQVGLCVECRETWNRETIGLLAEHIRLESAAERPSHELSLCWCAWPRPAVETWPSLCPSCASPWCHRAGWAAALTGADESPEHAWVS